MNTCFSRWSLGVSGFATLIAFTLSFSTNIFAQQPSPAVSPEPSAKPSPSPAADYDLRWGVKIPMRDKVELNATHLPRSGGAATRTPVIFT